MKGDSRRRAARNGHPPRRDAQVTWRRWFAAGLVIAGLLLLAAGTALAYSEWQAQAEVPASFGPDARALRPLSKSGAVDDAAPGGLSEGAELPPLEAVPGPMPRPTDARLALPIVRGNAVNGAGGTSDNVPARRDIPRAPSWVDSIFSAAPAERASTPTPSRGAPVDPYPLPTPTMRPSPVPTPEPTATPTATPYPVASAPPTHIEIPKIGVHADVVPVTWREVEYHGQIVRVWNVADFAAGWHETSHYPGQSGNIVISGHNNIRGEVFRDVVNLEAGDEVFLTADGLRFVYVVDSKMVIPEKGRPMEERLENNRWIGYFEDERLTLVTCWPYTSNTHRVVVVARPRR